MGARGHAGVARDELPYSEKFEEIWSGFQDRTFKNADPEQVYGALLKYTRSSSNSATELPPSVDGWRRTASAGLRVRW